MIEAVVPVSEEQRIVVRERLRLLTIVAYIQGGITAAFSCFFLIYVLMFAIMGTLPDSAWANSTTAPHQSSANSSDLRPSPAQTPQVVNQGPPKLFFGVMAAFFGAFVLLGLTIGGLTAYAGWCIHRRQRKFLVLIVSGIDCVFFPYGTLFGVATILVLSSPIAKAEFETGLS